MGDIAVITLSGRLAKDPEMSYTPDGTAITRVTLASNYYRSKQQLTSWYYITFWRAQAENVAQYIVKGQQITVVGNLTIEDWTDKSGNTRSSAKVNAIDVSFGAKPKNASNNEESPPDTWKIEDL